MVFPLPVPPLIKILYFALTNVSKTLAICGVIDLYFMSCSTVIGILENLRMVRVGPFNATGGNTTLTLEPSGNLVSTIGFD